MSRHIQVRPITYLERVLQYEFQNKNFLRQALTHASAISEKHPMAFNRDLAALAFVGDSALKYAVARYLFLNGQDEVVEDIDEMHKGTQTVIPNKILADIAREKLHLEDYVIRGNGHRTLSTKMYADCLEAILGAISLDCGTDHQDVIFRVIEKLFSDRYETLLKPTANYRLLSFDDDDDETVNVTLPLWSRMTWMAGPGEVRNYHRSPSQQEGLDQRWARFGFFETQNEPKPKEV